jgi:hypothetical protein
MGIPTRGQRIHKAKRTISVVEPWNFGALTGKAYFAAARCQRAKSPAQLSFCAPVGRISLTPRFSGVCYVDKASNRFSGFLQVGKPLKRF